MRENYIGGSWVPSASPAVIDVVNPATDAELYALCVAQDQAGRGHGSRLLNAAAATMAEDGFGTVSAWVLERDAPARRFLESAGWAADGARQELDMGIAVPAIRLHAALDPAG